mgnify:CR=1 FL=1
MRRSRRWSATPQYDDFPGLTHRRAIRFPQRPVQNNFESRYDLNWHKNTHDIKIGAEYLRVSTPATGTSRRSAATR